MKGTLHLSSRELEEIFLKEELDEGNQYWDDEDLEEEWAEEEEWLDYEEDWADGEEWLEEWEK